MQVAFGAPQVDLEIGHAAQAVADGRNAAIEHRRVRDDDDVGGQFLLVRADEVVEVHAADFFLAFDERDWAAMEKCLAPEVFIDYSSSGREQARVMSGVEFVQRRRDAPGYREIF